MFSFYVKNKKKKKLFNLKQVYTYISVLYTYILDLNEDPGFTLYNGAAESLNTLVGNKR